MSFIELNWVLLLFAAILGACIGSFLNVVIYRVPAGRSIVTPPSACPKCHTRLTFFDNIPVLAWFWLGGKCRYCKQPISVQYPLIEALCAVLFAGLLWVYYNTGLSYPIKDYGIVQAAPVVIVHYMLVGALVAATVIDARHLIIPLTIPWVVIVVAVVGLPLAAILSPDAVGNLAPRAENWGVHLAMGATIGLVIALGLLRLGILPHSFADQISDAEPPAEQEADQEAAQSDGANGPPMDASSSTEPVSATPEAPDASMPTRAVDGSASRVQSDSVGSAASTLATDAAPVSADVAAEATDTPSWSYATAEQIIAHPHVRREVLKECLFVAFPLVGAVLALVLARAPARGGTVGYALPWQILGGMGCGFFVGAGVVWFTRIAGTLGFKKEAMGLGDVHLLAAIGAVLGAKEAVLIFFVAPVMGVIYVFVALGVTRVVKGQVKIIPFGPFLALATIVVMLVRNPLFDFGPVRQIVDMLSSIF